MFNIRCDGCQRSYRVDERFAGRRMRCKECGAVLEVPRNKNLEETAVLEAGGRSATDAAAEATEGAAGGAAKLAKTDPAGRVPKRPVRPAKSRSAAAGARRGSKASRESPESASTRARAARRTKDERSSGGRAVWIGAAIIVAGLGAAVAVLDPFEWFGKSGPGNSSEKELGRSDSRSGEGEKAAAVIVPVPEDVWAAVPAESNAILHVDVAKLEALVERFNEPSEETDPDSAAREEVGALSALVPGAPDTRGIETTAEAAKEAGLEPSSLVIASVLPGSVKELEAKMLALGFEAEPDRNLESTGPGGASSDPSAAPPAGIASVLKTWAVVSGDFDLEKGLAWLRKEGFVGPGEMKIDGLPTFEILANGEPHGRGAFLGRRFAVAAETPALLGEALASLRVDGDPSIRENAALASLTSNLESPDALWFAVDLPETLASEIVEGTEKETDVRDLLEHASVDSFPAIDGVFVGVGLDERENLRIRGIVLGESEADAERAHSILSFLLGQFGSIPGLGPIIQGIELPPASARRVELAFVVRPEEIRARIGQAMGALAPLGPPPGAEGEGEDPFSGSDGFEIRGDDGNLDPTMVPDETLSAPEDFELELDEIPSRTEDAGSSATTESAAEGAFEEELDLDLDDLDVDFGLEPDAEEGTGDPASGEEK